MKRVGHLFERVLDTENLKLAFWKASRGKRHRPDQQAFLENLDDEIALMQAGLRSGDFPIGEYHRFKIHDPKERTICAVPFRERVLHHALMNVCEPFFDSWLVERTYACRRGKGQAGAVKKAIAYGGQYSWYLKCDVRKFFDTIPHNGIRDMISRKFKDPRIIGWFERILSTYETETGRGLPMGNLTSQHFANLYLDRIDRLPCLAGLGYVRYMDDFIVWSDDKEQLKRVRAEVSRCLAELGLSLNENCSIGRMERGLNFLGKRICGGRATPTRISRTRFRRNARRLEMRFSAGEMGETELQVRLTSMTAAMRPIEFRKRTKGCLACHVSTEAAAGGIPLQIAAPPGGTATARGTRGTTTASALLARSTAGCSDGPRSLPASDNSERMSRERGTSSNAESNLFSSTARRSESHGQA